MRVQHRFISTNGHDTFCRVVGDISKGIPLVIVHGGPGFSWDYLEAFDSLHNSGVPVVYYDQLWSGQTVPKTPVENEPSLASLCSQLQDLLVALKIEGNYLLLGHSAGAMIAIEHALRRPLGLRGLVLANAFASIRLIEDSLKALRQSLPAHARCALEQSEVNTIEYTRAMSEFFAQFVCRMYPVPDPLLRTLAASSQNPSTFRRLWGETTFDVTGTYSGWSAVSRLSAIDVPTLAYRGEYDEVGADCVVPFLTIPDVRLATLHNASHLPHLEVPISTRRLIAGFIGSLTL